MVPAAVYWDVFQAAIKKDCFGLFPGDDDILDPENYWKKLLKIIWAVVILNQKQTLQKVWFFISGLIDWIMEWIDEKLLAYNGIQLSGIRVDYLFLIVIMRRYGW